MALLSRSFVTATLGISTAALLVVVAGASTSGSYRPITTQLKTLEGPLAFKVAGEPRECLANNELTLLPVNEELILFHGEDQVFANSVRLGCNKVALSGEQPVPRIEARVCAGSTVQLAERGGGDSLTVCHLGTFTPVELVSGD